MAAHGNAMQSRFHIHPTDITTVSRICTGDDSHVYTGLYKNRRTIAVKILQGTALVDAEKDKFDRQVRILKRVNHDNIVKFIGALVKDESTMMIVLEFMENSRNVERIISSGDLPDLGLVTLVNIALSISKAMEYLHSQGIMHCNLKSSNILMTLRVVKLIGFGNAVEERVDSENARRLRKMDVLSFGILLQELLRTFIIRKAKGVNVRTPHNVSIGQIPPSLVELMEACMLEDPDSRPEFKVITQDLEIISSSADRARGLDPVYGKVISSTPSATVYEARYNLTDIAVKMYKQATLAFEINRRREKYDRQVAVLSTAHHENIIEFIGATAEPALRIMTEYMEGGTLEKYMLKIKPNVPDIELGKTFALGISEGMQHLHAQGFTHRDLKSSNVYLRKDKKLVKLGGFGYAKKEKPDETNLENFKADVYDFSQILWEILTNKHSTFKSYASSMKEKRPLLNEVPDELLELMMRCASEREEDRPEFKQITATLTELTDDESHLATFNKLLYESKKEKTPDNEDKPSDIKESKSFDEGLLLWGRGGSRVDENPLAVLTNMLVGRSTDEGHGKGGVTTDGGGGNGGVTINEGGGNGGVTRDEGRGRRAVSLKGDGAALKKKIREWFCIL